MTTRLRHLILPLIASLALIGCAETAPQQAHSIEGEWRVTGMIVGGKPEDLPEGFAATITFQDGEFRYSTSTGDDNTGTYVIDESAETLMISYEIYDGKPTDHVEVMHYRFDGKHLLLARRAGADALQLERTT